MEDNKVVVILEDLRSQFRVFGEGQEALIKKVDNLIKEVDILKEDSTIIKAELVHIKSLLTRKVDVEEFDKLEQRVIRLENIVASQQH